ncbi:MAG: hypothetical protein DDT26_01580 [Dehalococcoidia bacterium]|nr:hypothetical protein [Chloroflexota bacterium]
MRTKVVILDMQPITPAVGGGRQRLLGLYHALGDNIDAVYVGSYDWPGEAYRDHQLTPSLREICVPLSDNHHQAAKASTERYGGRVTIDMEFHRQVELSPEYLAVATREIDLADVVIFSHPWCFPPLQRALREGQLVVYDSQNVEAFLRWELHGDVPEMSAVLKEVARIEQDLLSRADLVYCCSSEEVAMYQRIFETPLAKLRVAPNGTFLLDEHPAKREREKQISDKLLSGNGIERPVAVFIGSQYGPNVDAARMIVEEVAPSVPEVDFLVVGGVGGVFVQSLVPENVVLSGVVSEQDKAALLATADFALNPMLSGAGTNVKMFDFLAAGLPVVATPVGARGIVSESTSDGAIQVVEASGIVEAVVARSRHPVTCAERKACRAIVDRRFNNAKISRCLGEELRFYSRGVGVPRPRVAIFSTWSIRCGIAEHARYLAEGFRQAGVDPLILANRVAHHPSAGFEGDLRFPATPIWHWDNIAWRDSHVEWDDLIRFLDASHLDAMMIQHHSAYLWGDAWSRLIKEAATRSIPVVVECHDPRAIQDGDLTQLAHSGATVVVHSRCDREHLVRRGVDATVVPLGVRDFSRPSTASCGEGLVVGGFGFFRQHKGIDVVLEAMATLSAESGIPPLKYRGWHAIYPGEEKSGYVARCLELASRVGNLVDVHIGTEFLDVDDVVAQLAQCDIIALAYAESNEGGSASAGAALSSGVPIVCTPSAIFDDLGDGVVRSRDFCVQSFAEALRAVVVMEPGLRDEYRSRSRALRESRSYTLVASQLLSLARGETAYVK